MSFQKLPSNSKKLLDELAQSSNPTQLLCDRLKSASSAEEEELRGILKELRQAGYVDTRWASGSPYRVNLSNAGRTYNERLAEYEATVMQRTSRKMDERTIIFISHRTTDKSIADMLVDFFCGTGIPRDVVFCSSLPGNDVNERISKEVKNALTRSAINIAILSRDYYQSAYCLNEAGILWYQEDIPVIPIALPEINPDNMYGFLNGDYKIRRLDCDTDISFIYDAVHDAVSAQQSKMSVVTYEMQKIKERYSSFLESREDSSTKGSLSAAALPTDLTDDEKVLIYYILTNNARKVEKATMMDWLQKNEIFTISVDNAFDLLASLEGNSLSDGIFELDADVFRRYMTNATTLLPELKACVDTHTRLASDTFVDLWNSGAFSSTMKLFVSYIVDERIEAFGDRWMAEGQIESIKHWEEKNSLFSVLSENYGSCLNLFVKNKLVYESEWTSHGNPRQYTLYDSLQKLLFSYSELLHDELKKCKLDARDDLPF